MQASSLCPADGLTELQKIGMTPERWFQGPCVKVGCSPLSPQIRWSLRLLSATKPPIRMVSGAYRSIHQLLSLVVKLVFGFSCQATEEQKEDGGHRGKCQWSALHFAISNSNIQFQVVWIDSVKTNIQNWINVLRWFWCLASLLQT